MWLTAIFEGLGIGSQNTQNNKNQKQEDAALLSQFLNRETKTTVDTASIVFGVIVIALLIIVLKTK